MHYTGFGKGASGVGLGDSVSHGHVRVPPQNHLSSVATNCEFIFEFEIYLSPVHLDSSNQFQSCPLCPMWGQDCPIDIGWTQIPRTEEASMRLVTGGSISPGCSRVLPLNSDPSNTASRWPPSNVRARGRLQSRS